MTNNINNIWTSELMKSELIIQSKNAIISVYKLQHFQVQAIYFQQRVSEHILQLTFASRLINAKSISRVMIEQRICFAFCCFRRNADCEL